MAKRSEYKMTIEERKLRRFSENFKREKVREIDLKKTKITDICRVYEVSKSTVREWINKYGMKSEKGVKIIVETESDTNQLLALKKQVAELERIVGQKQIQLDFKDKMIDIAEEMYGVDIKKKCLIEPLSTFGTTEKKTDLV